DCAFDLRKFDPLSLAGPFALVQRRENPKRAGKAAHRIAQRVRERVRLFRVVVAGEPCNSGHRLDRVAIAARVGLGTPVAERRHRDHDQPRINRPQNLPIESEAFHYAGAVVLDQDVGGGDQPFYDFDSARIVQVERHAQLAAIGGVEGRCALDGCISGGPIESEPRHQSKNCVSSTLTTSAPISASIWPSNGPAQPIDRSSTLILPSTIVLIAPPQSFPRRASGLSPPD